MYELGLILFVIHIVAFIAGGANSVIMPIIGPRLATATPEVRGQLMGIVEGVATHVYEVADGAVRELMERRKD